MANQFEQLNLWGQAAKPTVKQQVSELSADEGLDIPASRQKSRETMWNTWRSRSDRQAVHDGLYEEEEAPDTHPFTGLPERGNYFRAHDENQWLHQRMPFTGYGSGRRDPIPNPMSYHYSAKTSWRKHSTTEYVPLNQPINSPQGEVSLERVHQLMADREGVSDSRSARGLQRELPRMFRDHSDGLHIIDGNHRVTSDILAGRLFTEARVAYPHNGPSFEKTNRDIEMKKFRAQDRHGTEHYERLNNLWNGRTADGEWSL